MTTKFDYYSYYLCFLCKEYKHHLKKLNKKPQVWGQSSYEKWGTECKVERLLKSIFILIYSTNNCHHFYHLLSSITFPFFCFNITWVCVCLFLQMLFNILFTSLTSFLSLRHITNWKLFNCLSPTVKNFFLGHFMGVWEFLVLCVCLFIRLQKN